MTALTSSPPAPPHVAAAHRLTLGRTLRSETIKTFTLRSTWWSLGVGIALSVALPVLSVVTSLGSEAGPSAYDIATIALVFLQLVLPIFGVLTITGEFSTGSIRTTLTAQPSRSTVVLAKSAVVVSTATLASLLTYAIALLSTAPFVVEGLDWSTPQYSMLPIATGLLSTVVCTLVGFGLGLIIRNPGGAISATMAVLYVLPAALNIVWGLMSNGDPSRDVYNFANLLPTQAGSMLASPDLFDPVVPLFVLSAWSVVPVFVGAVLLRRRDV